MNDLAPWLGLVLAALVVWVSARSYMRKQRAREAEVVVGASYEACVLQVLANAARIDGRVDDAERQAIADAMTQIKGVPFTRAETDAAIERARLTKEQLLAYLQTRAGVFSTEQTFALLKGVLSVAMADGRFDQREHHIYLAYIEAIGFDRQQAPEMLRGLVKDLAAGKYS